jgi:hypothetical protein
MLSMVYYLIQIFQLSSEKIFYTRRSRTSFIKFTMFHLLNCILSYIFLSHLKDNRMNLHVPEYVYL